MRNIAVWICAADLCLACVLVAVTSAPHDVVAPAAFAQARAAIIAEIRTSPIEIGYALAADGRIV